MTTTQSEATSSNLLIKLGGRYASRSEVTDLVGGMLEKWEETLDGLDIALYFTGTEAAAPGFLGELVKTFLVTENAATLTIANAHDRHVQMIKAAAKSYSVTNKVFYV